VVIDNGAYVSWGSTTPYVMLSTTAGLYRVPAVRFDTTIVYTNNPYSGSMRGYGNLESTFAIEAQMDDLAERLHLDRVEIRRRNATRPGDVNPQGNVITSCAMTECLDAVEREIGRADAAAAPRPGWRRGVGYAGMFHVGGGARVYRSDGCGAILKLDDFGKVSLLTGASEIGQGSETVLAMIVAEELGVPLGRVEVVNSDTSIKPWDVGVHASRTTFIAGNAALLAARALKDKLLALGATVMDERAEALELAAGRVRVKGHPERGMEYDRVVRAGHFREGGRTLVAEAFYDPPNEMLSKDLRGNVSAAYGFAAQAALVEVSLATGEVRVLTVASAHDVGRALNPLAAEGQIHGGIHMGLGYALSEELHIEAGRVLNPQWMEYALIPAALMPEIIIDLIETVDEAGPFGAKGLGESGVIPVAAAVANAVKDAVGVRLTELPMTPERVFRALAARPPAEAGTP
jgi:xanthine dehydrogenase molybdenum-binding subunit